MDNLERNMLTIKGKKETPLGEALKTIRRAFTKDNINFTHDVERIDQIIQNAREQMFGGKTVSKSNLSITDRVDLKAHALIGERPVNSCQHYDGDSNLNVGLLSYLTDPNVKIIQIYNEEGEIIARSIFRLMADKAGKPRLFMEGVYSVNPHEKIKEAMTNFAQTKAKKMGIKFCDDKETLYNSGSRCPFVYTDAGGGKMPQGKFTVNG